jgi:hypothetical protein
MRNMGLKFCCRIWLGVWYLFQTFDELDQIKDKANDALEIRQLLDDDDSSDTIISQEDVS